jgi:hypothetical protein
MDKLRLLKLTMGRVAVTMSQIKDVYSDVRLSSDDVAALRKFNTAHFGENSCYDYVAELYALDNQCAMTVFVEPAGDVVKLGTSYAAVIDWWRECFEAQPDGLGYAEAGYRIATMKMLPSRGVDVWNVSRG